MRTNKSRLQKSLQNHLSNCQDCPAIEWHLLSQSTEVTLPVPVCTTLTRSTEWTDASVTCRATCIFWDQKDFLTTLRATQSALLSLQATGWVSEVKSGMECCIVPVSGFSTIPGISDTRKAKTLPELLHRVQVRALNPCLPCTKSRPYTRAGKNTFGSQLLPQESPPLLTTQSF